MATEPLPTLVYSWLCTGCKRLSRREVDSPILGIPSAEEPAAGRAMYCEACQRRGREYESSWIERPPGWLIAAWQDVNQRRPISQMVDANDDQALANAGLVVVPIAAWQAMQDALRSICDLAMAGPVMDRTHLAIVAAADAALAALPPEAMGPLGENDG